ncbi:MAG: hypothetical protein F6K19_09030, partial [Cyanothece sp. SIO1E1]|nr:hypothetical protein [Cyanothece sp. SIO1E1]
MTNSFNTSFSRSMQFRLSKFLKFVLIGLLTTVLIGSIPALWQKTTHRVIIPQLESSPGVALGAYDPDGNFNQADVLIEHQFVTWRLDNANELVTALQRAKQ